MFVDPYLIPGTNCLKNKLGITDADVLGREEATFAFARETALSIRTLPGKYDIDHLKKFHKRLFGDVYEWAGIVRDVTLSKDGSPFCHPRFLHDQMSGILGALERDKFLIGLKQEYFTEQLAYYYGELNVCHPFREGNGRTQRAFWRQLSAAAGFRLSWSELDPDANDRECARYMVTADTGGLIALLAPIVSQI